MSIRSEIDRISSNVSDAFDAIAEKGGEVTQATSDALADAIRSIPEGSEYEVYDGTVV